MSTAVVPIETRELGRVDEEWSVERMVSQTLKIKQCMEAVMIRDEHYGVIPGTGGRDGKPPKPTLLKPGAEKLCLMFRLCPEYETLRAEQSAVLISYTIRCRLTHIPTGNLIATGLGSCNSREKKYTRPADKKCPSCSKETIIKGKEEYGGGWLCFAKKGGCGAKFKDGDAAIEKQDNGLADPSDLDNTILKMACKRALVAAVLNGTAASDCFTQDLEDLSEKAAEYTPPAKPESAGPKGETVATASPPTHTHTGISTPISGSTTGSTATSKPPRADTIPHDGRMASDVQVARLVELATQAGTFCKGGCAVTTSKWSKKAGAAVPASKLCTYHTQLAAFKDPDGKPCGTPGALSETQLDNLVSRYEAKVQRAGDRASQGVDIGAVVPVQPPRNLDDELMRTFPQALDKREWLNGYFGVDSIKQLDVKERETALALIEAWEQPQQDKIEAEFRAAGRIK